jgi:4a-hydroxytetrahydrobiopterin dehydratase
VRASYTGAGSIVAEPAKEMIMANRELLSDEAVQAGMARLERWELRDGRIRKQYQFRTFLRAVAFVNSVAYLAESAGHHPDITINFNRVTLRLITHSEGGLTELDFALAAEIDAKLGTKLLIAPEETSEA